MKTLKIIFTFSIFTSISFAHSLWVNSFESYKHKPGHILVSLGWGHSMPLDDIPNSVNGRVNIEDFYIYTPSKEKIKLKLPTKKIAQAFYESDSFDIYEADMAFQKVQLKKDTPKGVYTIKAKSKTAFYTKFIDTKNRTRLKLKTIDQIKNVKKVLWSVKFQSFAKSYLSLGEWNEQSAQGDAFEIIPKSDLSNVKVGDILEFEVLFMGKPLNTSANSIETIKAFSNGFGEKEGFAISSDIINGRAKIKVLSPGQWNVLSKHKEDVTKDGNLKHLYNKVKNVFHSASLTFTVKE